MELACYLALKADLKKLILLNIQIQAYLTFSCRARHSLVGTVTLYGLDGRTRWGQDIFYSLYLSRLAPKPHSFLCNG